MFHEHFIVYSKVKKEGEQRDVSGQLNPRNSHDPFLLIHCTQIKEHSSGLTSNRGCGVTRSEWFAPNTNYCTVLTVHHDLSKKAPVVKAILVIKVEFNPYSCDKHSGFCRFSKANHSHASTRHRLWKQSYINDNQLLQQSPLSSTLMNLHSRHD
jgi:hypothetical protein